METFPSLQLEPCDGIAEVIVLFKIIHVHTLKSCKRFLSFNNILNDDFQ